MKKQSNLLAALRIASVLVAIVAATACAQRFMQDENELYLITYFACAGDVNGVCFEVDDGRDTSIYAGTSGGYLSGVTMNSIKLGGLTCTNRDVKCLLRDKLDAAGK